MFSSAKCLLSTLLKTSVRNFYYWPRYLLHLEELSGSKELLVEVNPHLNEPQEKWTGTSKLPHLLLFYDPLGRKETGKMESDLCLRFLLLFRAHSSVLFFLSSSTAMETINYPALTNLHHHFYGQFCTEKELPCWKCPAGAARM